MNPGTSLGKGPRARAAVFHPKKGRRSGRKGGGADAPPSGFFALEYLTVCEKRPDFYLIAVRCRFFGRGINEGVAAPPAGSRCGGRSRDRGWVFWGQKTPPAFLSSATCAGCNLSYPRRCRGGAICFGASWGGRSNSLPQKTSRGLRKSNTSISIRSKAFLVHRKARAAAQVLVKTTQSHKTTSHVVSKRSCQMFTEKLRSWWFVTELFIHFNFTLTSL